MGLLYILAPKYGCKQPPILYDSLIPVDFLVIMLASYGILHFPKEWEVFLSIKKDSGKCVMLLEVTKNCELG